MALFEQIVNAGYKSISLIGMSKNAGKTVALNHLIDSAQGLGVTLGLTSIGRDGERQDLVTETHKPTIYVYSGTVIATTKNFVEQATARMEILASTSIHTAMGTIIIAKVTYDGYIELAGPSTTGGTSAVVELLRSFGAEVVLVDGALDRRSLASPSVTEATVLSTGAALHRQMLEVVNLTAHRVNLFHLPVINEAYRDVVAELMQAGRVGLVKCLDDQIVGQTLDFKTALGAGQLIAGQVDQDTTHIVIPGSFGNYIIDSFLEVKKHLKDITWVVEDATKIFIAPGKWRYYLKKGLTLCIKSPIKLVGITYNPTSPKGYTFDPDEFEMHLKTAIPDVPIIDVMAEEIPWNF